MNAWLGGPVENRETTGFSRVDKQTDMTSLYKGDPSLNLDN